MQRRPDAGGRGSTSPLGPPHRAGPTSASDGLADGAREQLKQRLGGDFDQPAEPENRGWPLAVVNEPVGGCAPDPEQRGGLDEVEDRWQRVRGIQCRCWARHARTRGRCRRRR